MAGLAFGLNDLYRKPIEIGLGAFRNGTDYALKNVGIHAHSPCFNLVLRFGRSTR
jgi:hypothetical protein